MMPASPPRTLHWTPEARTRLELWLAPRVAAAAHDGAAAEEVADGLRAHVHEELMARSVDTVDEDHLSRVLAAIDGPSAVRTGGAAPPALRPAAPVPSGFRWPRILLFFGVLLPALTWAAEWALGLCASEFFDPLPTLWHVLLVALVPASLWFVHRTVQRHVVARTRLAAAFCGVALAIAAFYTLAFGPLLGLAAASTVLSILLPWLMPLPWMTLAAPLAGVASLFGLRRLRRLAPCGRAWASGLALGTLLVAAGEMPRWMALDAMRTAATSPDETERSTALDRLRSLPGARVMIHETCFGEGRNRGGSIDVTSWMAQQLDRLTASAFSPDITMEQGRALFYRVTGQAFTEVKPRSARRVDVFDMRVGVGRATRTDWVWDGERGGEAVGARLPGLALATSRMEWHAEPEARLGYGEWTLEFSNDHANPQEARAQIKLPPAACVSRLTLWVNGEPQEAAFAAQSAVRAAYQQVVVVEQRDPVLVTQVGPDTVMMQCFPVPAKGGRMKIRLGITAPFDSQGRLSLPHLIERNFSLPRSLRHTLWVQSRKAFEASTPGTTETTDTGAQTWQADLSQTDLDTAAFTWPPATAPDALWCEDPLAGPSEPRFVTARWQTPPDAPPTAVAVVVDGSLSLRALRPLIAQALEGAARKSKLAAWIATDAAARPLDLTQSGAGLADADFTGGREALTALRAALSWARGQPGPAAVVWLHGPQPADLGDPAALEQMLEFGLRHIPILDVPLVPGAHRLSERLYRRSDLRGVERITDPAAALPSLLEDVLKGRQPPVLVTARQQDPPTSGTQTSDQLARYAAFASTIAAFRSTAPVPAAVIASAARHQVVTPVTGAVVLESKRQYDENGLSQVDPSSTPKVPTIPEPGVLSLLLAAATLALRRRRKIF